MPDPGMYFRVMVMFEKLFFYVMDFTIAWLLYIIYKWWCSILCTCSHFHLDSSFQDCCLKMCVLLDGTEYIVCKFCGNHFIFPDLFPFQTWQERAYGFPLCVMNCVAMSKLLSLEIAPVRKQQ